MKLKNTGVDFRTATQEEILAAMNRGVRVALRHHKEAGVPAVVWDDETSKIVAVPPDQIPDFPEEDEGPEGPPDAS